ncbi:MAG: phosphate ABC transporter permease subunit PstC [Gemmataceae bacterium]
MDTNSPGQQSPKPSLLLSDQQNFVGSVLAVLGRTVLFLVAATSIFAVILIFAFIIREALPFFFEGESFWTSLAHAWQRVQQLFGSTNWDSTHGKFGALTLLAGSLYVTAIALIVAVPISLLAAMCLSDIFPFWLRQIVKPIVELLAAIPSVAYGFFALLVFAPLLQEWGLTTGTNALNAGLILGVMAVPTILSVSEDSLTSVGSELRQGAYALGSTRAETLCLVVVPAAKRGILAAVILGLMRAIGETMVVWMASGNATQIPHPWWDLSQSIRTMTATVAGEMGETARNTTHYHALFAVGFLLLLFTFLLNLMTELLVGRKGHQGGSKT